MTTTIAEMTLKGAAPVESESRTPSDGESTAREVPRMTKIPAAAGSTKGLGNSPRNSRGGDAVEPGAVAVSATSSNSAVPFRGLGRANRKRAAENRHRRPVLAHLRGLAKNRRNHRQQLAPTHMRGLRKNRQNRPASHNGETGLGVGTDATEKSGSMKDIEADPEVVLEEEASASRCSISDSAASPSLLNPSHGGEQPSVSHSLSNAVASSSLLSASRGDSGLAVALPVKDDSDPEALTAAHQVDLEEIHRKKVQRQRKECKIAGCTFIAACCIALAIALGVSQRSKGRDDVLSSSTIAPYASTEAPSSASTSPLELLLETLPNQTIQSLENGTTPQWHARVWLERHPELQDMQAWRVEQLLALATFYYAMAGENWPLDIKGDWMVYEKPECLWFSNSFGVFSGEDADQYLERDDPTYNVTPCDENDRIQSIVLGELNLTGYNAFLPPEIALLTSLSVLALPSAGNTASISEFIPSQMYQMESLSLLNFANSLRGPIPTELGMMTNLDSLGLYGNALIGTIPSELGRMAGLTQLLLSGNSLTGAIPSEFGMMSNMEDLQVQTNTLDGPIPSEIGLMTRLTTLCLNSNNLTGPIPTELGLATRLLDVALFNNFMTGTIPSELGLMTATTRLYVYSNDLTTTIPTELGMMVYVLDLQLNANTLFGVIPSELGLLTSITSLQLSGNDLFGPIPRELANLSNMLHLSLHSNFLSGPIPSEIGRMTSLEGLLCFDNGLYGQIPTQLGFLTNLTALQLNQNSLSGKLPRELGSMTSLTNLFLSENSFSGMIPSELGLLTSMMDLSVRSNSLTGRIPSELGRMDNSVWFYLYSNSLSGVIPSELGGITLMSSLSLRMNNLSGSVPSELGLMSYLEVFSAENNSLRGSIPEEFVALAKNGPLRKATLANNLLTGIVSEELCSLGMFNLSVPGGDGISFDCSERLCGCEWCDCGKEAPGSGSVLEDEVSLSVGNIFFG